MTVYYLESQYPPTNGMTMFLELSLHLKEKYGAKIVHQKGGVLKIEKFNYDLPDSVLFIHDESINKLIGITVEDNPGQCVDIFIKRNKPGDILIVSQFHNRFPKDFDKSIYNFTIKNGTYYAGVSFTNYDFHYLNRKLLTNLYYETLIDQMFFLGTERHDISELRDQNLCSLSTGNVPHLEYLDMAIKHKVGFSVSGVGEMCYRDIEYLSIGLPLLRMEYMTQLNPPLIPNYHYISVDRKQFPWDMNKDREGGPLYIEEYKKRFLEVKDDKVFLLSIAKNGREYYESYLHPLSRLNHLLNIIEL